MCAEWTLRRNFFYTILIVFPASHLSLTMGFGFEALFFIRLRQCFDYFTVHRTTPHICVCISSAVANDCKNKYYFLCWHSNFPFQILSQNRNENWEQDERWKKKKWCDRRNAMFRNRYRRCGENIMRSSSLSLSLYRHHHHNHHHHHHQDRWKPVKTNAYTIYSLSPFNFIHIKFSVSFIV